MSDVFGTGDQFHEIMRLMGSKRRGVIVYLREGSVGVAHQGSRNRPAPGGEGHEEARRRESEWREIGLGAQILRDLGTSSPRESATMSAWKVLASGSPGRRSFET